MTLTLKIYTDETLTEVERVVNVDKLKIPYRAAMLIIGSLKNIDIKNNYDLFGALINCIDEIDPIIKATFGISDNELERVDVTELGAVGMELYKWAIGKVQNLQGGGIQKNA